MIRKGLESKLKANEDEKVIFEVICQGNPKPNYVWFRNGVEIRKPTGRDNYSIIERGDSYLLIFEKLRVSDGGLITFAAKGKNSVVQTSCFLEVDGLFFVSVFLFRFESVTYY